MESESFLIWDGYIEMKTEGMRDLFFILGSRFHENALLDSDGNEMNLLEKDDRPS
ncbi:MAG: hypothetical protein JRI67_11725 [Deltaproteobacteria bacterium]|nr:hypothetical protein [Deltaproteobacteria bacterium]